MKFKIYGDDTEHPINHISNDEMDRIHSIAEIKDLAGAPAYWSDDGRLWPKPKATITIIKGNSNDR